MQMPAERSFGVRALALGGGRARRLQIGYLLTMLASFGFRLSFITRPPLDLHSFRQTQTLFSALYYTRDGISLLHPKTPVLGKPWEIPFEFPLFQALVAMVHSLTGLSLSTCGRLLGLVSYAVCLVALYFIARLLGVSARAAHVAILVFNLTPFLFVWTISALIEWFSVLLVLVACLAAVGLTRALARGAAGRPFAIAFGSLAVGLWALAGAVKVTTLMACGPLLPLLLWRVARRKSSVIVFGLCGTSALAAAMLWAKHADAVKSKSVETAWMTSKALQTWNFGSTRQRMTLFPYLRITLMLAVCLWPIVIGALIYLFGRMSKTLVTDGTPETRVTVVSLSLAVLVGPLVFFNLFYQHDYYFCEIVPVGVVACALVVNRFNRHALAVFVAIGGCVALAGSGYAARTYGPVSRYEGARFLVGAKLLTDHCPAGEVLIIHEAWDPSLLYLADRRGMMADGAKTLDRQFAKGTRVRHEYACALVPKAMHVARIESEFTGGRFSAGAYDLFVSSAHGS
jgi:hypothetical protein